MPEHYLNISFAKPCYFQFASGNTRQLGTLNYNSHNSRSIKTSCNHSFLVSGSFQHTGASLFLYSLFVTMLICSALGIFCWSICKLYVVSVFFNLRIVSKSPPEMSTPIGAVQELHSRANLPGLEKLAIRLHSNLDVKG